jgi:hypothetical protein
MNNYKGIMDKSGFEGCQLPCVPEFAIATARYPAGSVIKFFKQLLAFPWNRYVKKFLKRSYYYFVNIGGKSKQQLAAKASALEGILKEGDLIRVRSFEEIKRTLDPFGELKGCAFLQEMRQYCGTEQKVFKVMHRFMDERDYKMKKTRGLILLENVFCSGTPVFGPCDRSCFLYWREEWLEKVE